MDYVDFNDSTSVGNPAYLPIDERLINNGEEKEQKNVEPHEQEADESAELLPYIDRRKRMVARSSIIEALSKLSVKDWLKILWFFALIILSALSYIPIMKIVLIIFIFSSLYLWYRIERQSRGQGREKQSSEQRRLQRKSKQRKIKNLMKHFGALPNPHKPPKRRR